MSTTDFFVQGATRMSGGIPLITLPAGYLGSSFLGACMIACGFDTNASKVATLVLAGIFVLALFWARRQLLSVYSSLGRGTSHPNPFIQAVDPHLRVRGTYSFILVRQPVDCTPVSGPLHGRDELHVW